MAAAAAPRSNSALAREWRGRRSGGFAWFIYLARVSSPSRRPSVPIPLPIHFAANFSNLAPFNDGGRERWRRSGGDKNAAWRGVTSAIWGWEEIKT